MIAELLLGDSAALYAERGWRVIPLHYPSADGRCSCRRPGCQSAGKHPRPKAWQKRATTDAGKVAAWWAKDPECNVGIATGGEARLVVFDIDPKDGGFESLDKLLARHGQLPQTPTVITGSGGRHYYFRAPEGLEIPRNSAGKIGPGLDIRGEGGQVVAPPSLHASGQRYRWQLDPTRAELADLPQWIADAIRAPGKKKAAAGSAAEIVEGGRNAWMTSRAGHLRRLGLDQDMILTVLRGENATKCKPPLPAEELETIAASVGSYAPGKAAEVAPGDWRALLRQKTNSRGQPTGDFLPTRLNVCHVLQHDQQFRGQIWFDATRSRELIGDRTVQDHDHIRIANTLDREYDWHSLSSQKIAEAVSAVAQKNRVDVLRDYLTGLQWDGHERADTWLFHGIGAPSSPLVEAYARRFLIQLVARAMSPGCKADAVLVLYGPQGAGKSSLFRALVGDRWFRDKKIDLRSDDRFALVNAAWLYELQEISGFRASVADDLKAFITQQVDYWRPPYLRKEVEHPRRVCFCGSTNKKRFLMDPTGSRRFWVVSVSGPAQTEWLATWRDQLMAEALHYYRAGEQWHLTREEDQWRREEAGAYQDQEPWKPALEAFAASAMAPFSTTAALVRACKIPIARQSGEHMTRAADVLRSLGYQLVDGHVLIEGQRVKSPVWRKPGTVTPIGLPFEVTNGDDGAGASWRDGWDKGEA